MEKARKELDEVTVLMKDNIIKASEREGKLDDLEKRAEKLEQGANDFKVFYKIF